MLPSFFVLILPFPVRLSSTFFITLNSFTSFFSSQTLCVRVCTLVCVCSFTFCRIIPPRIIVFLIYPACIVQKEIGFVHVCVHSLVAFIFICASIETNFSVCKASLLRTHCIHLLERRGGNIVFHHPVICIFAGNIFNILPQNYPSLDFQAAKLMTF